MELWKRDSSTIAGVRKRLNRKLRPVLKYYELIFFCIHGGETFKRDREYHLMSLGLHLFLCRTFNQNMPML